MTQEPRNESPEVFDFVHQFLGDCRNGREQPLEHYLARFPGDAESIAREYVLLKDEQSAPQPVASVDAGGARVGPYRLIKELGRGGQATVHLAEDMRVGRKVALKVLPQHLGFISQERLGRFRREAELLAHLDHPGICGIYEADLDGGTPFLAMRYVEGETLARVLAALRAVNQIPRSQVEIHAVLRQIERVARALHAAHEAGVIHRDVKPANIMIAADEQPIVLDFGLARQEESDDPTLTAPGDVFGTLAYMSPEQLATIRAPIDRRTDVYSLGVTLYECLTGRRPFEAETREALWHAIESQRPRDPHALNAAIGADLRVIVLQALEKEPRARYQTTLAFAEDLRRVREYEPIAARPLGVATRAWRWSRRNPRLAVAIATILVLLTSLLVVKTVGLRDLEQKQREVDRQATWRNLARDVEDDLQNGFANAVFEAQSQQDELANNVLLTALRNNREYTRFLGHTSRIRALALSPDESCVATASLDGRVGVWEHGLARGAKFFDARAGTAWSIAFSPDGKRIVAAYDDGTVRVLDRHTLAATTISGAAGAVRAAEWSPDGRTILTASLGGLVRLHDANSGELLCTVHADATRSYAMARFSPDGTIIAITGGSQGMDEARIDDRLWLYDAKTRAPVAPPIGGVGAVNSIEFDAGSKRIVTASWDRHVRMFDASGARLWDQALAGRVHHAVCSPDGRLVAVAFDPLETHGESVLLMQAETGVVVRSLIGFDGRAAKRCAFSKDGRMLAAVGNDRQLHVWDVKSGAILHVFARLVGDGIGVVWRSDGETLFTFSNSNDVQRWSLAPRGVLELAAHQGPVTAVVFSPDGARVVSASRDGTLRVSDAATGKAVGAPLSGHAGPIVDVAFSPDGARILSASEDGTARVWDASTLRGKPLVGHTGPVSRVMFVPGIPPRALTISQDHTARLWDLERGVTLRELRGHEAALRCVAVSRDGAFAATGADDRTMRIWDLSDPAKTPVVARFESDVWTLKSVFSVAFSHDEARVVMACEDGCCYVVRRDDATRVFTTDPMATIGLALFGPGDRDLWINTRYNTATYRVVFPDSKPIRIERNSGGAMTSGSLSRDAAWFLATGGDGRTRIWSTRDAQRWEVFTGNGSPTLCAAFSPDSKNVVSGNRDGSIFIWPVDPLPVAEREAPFVRVNDGKGGVRMVSQR